MQNHVFGHFLSFFCHFLSFFHEKFHCLTSFLGFFQFFWFFFKPENSGPNQTSQKDGQKEPGSDKKVPKHAKKVSFLGPKMGSLLKKRGQKWVIFESLFLKCTKSFRLFLPVKKKWCKKKWWFFGVQKNHLQISRVSIFVTALIKWH